MTAADGALLLAWVAILGLALAVTGIIRQLRLLVAGQSPTGSGLGTSTASNVRVGDRIDVDWIGDAEVRLVVFLDSDCSACVELSPALAAAADRLSHRPSRVDTVGVFRGGVREIGQAISLPERADLFARFAIRVTPFAAVESKRDGVARTALVGETHTLASLTDLAETIADNHSSSSDGIEGNKPQTATERQPSWS